jgi:AraC-like DNA-binding protein
VATRRNATTSTGAGVLRPEELARHVQLERVPCGEQVSRWVENYWTLRWDFPEGAAWTSHTLAHPACTLSVERGPGRDEVGEDPVVVTGVPTHRFEVTLRGRGSVLAVKFRPGGFAARWGTPAAALRDRTVPAAGLLPDEVVDALRGMGPDDVGRLDDLLADDAAGADPGYDTVLDVIGRMLADRSLIRVGQVEEEVGLSTRQLQRLFSRYVGATPKWVLARYRLHDVVTALDEGYAGSLADLAAAYGWFDQAHFTREFTDLVGVPPSAYRDRLSGS